MRLIIVESMVASGRVGVHGNSVKAGHRRCASGGAPRVKMLRSKTCAFGRVSWSVRCAVSNQTEWTRFWARALTELTGVELMVAMALGFRRTRASRKQRSVWDLQWV